MSGSITSPPPGLGGVGGDPGDPSGNSSSSSIRRGPGGHRSTSSMSGNSAGGFPPGLAGGAQSPSSTSSSSLLTIVKAQISFLLSTLSDENFAKNRQDIAVLVEQHGAEAQNHYLRRLLLACAPTSSSPTSSSSATGNAANSSPANLSNALSPSGAAPTPVQATLYLRLLVQETKRLVADPLTAEKFVAAFQSGLNDQSATSSDIFKAIDIAALVDKLSLTPFEKGVLLLELCQLSLPDSVYGAKSFSQIVTQKRCEVGSTAANLLRQDETFQGFVQGLANAGLSPQQAAELLAKVASDLTIDQSTGEGTYAYPTPATSFTPVPSYGVRNVSSVIEAVFGSQSAASIIVQACGHVSWADQPAGLRVADCIDRLIRSTLVSTPDTMEAIFKAAKVFRDIKTDTSVESEVAKVVHELVCFFNGSRSSCVTAQAIVAGISNAVKAHHPTTTLKWSDIIKSCFDNTTASVHPDQMVLLDQILLVEVDSPTSPLSAFWSEWENPLCQLNIIEALLNRDFNFAPPSLPASNKVVSLEEFRGKAQENPHQLDSAVLAVIEGQIAQAEQSPYNHKNLIPLLFKLEEWQPSPPDFQAQTDVEHSARMMIERGSQVAPELELLSILRSEKPWSTTATDVYDKLLNYFLNGVPTSTLVLYEVMAADPEAFITKLKTWYTESELNVTRILDIANDFKLLPDILDQRPFYFALDVAALAGRREYLNLEKWLETSTTEHGSVFVRAALEFVGHKVRHDLGRQDQDVQQNSEPTMSLTAPIVATFLRALRSHHEIFRAEEIELFKEVRTQCLQLHPRLMNFAPSAEQEPGISVTTFNPEIEAEVDAFYKRMYDQEISVDNVVALLQRAKESDNVHDHEFLACFLHGLFDEYKFFATYPQQELTLTALLFGSLIQHHLIDYIPLGIAVRYVLDALRNPPDSNWFRFGVQALSRFQPRLHEWPSLAQAILNVPHLAQAHPEIANVARAALSAPEGQGLENGMPDDGGVDGVEALVEQPKAFTALKPDYIPGRGEIENPDEDTSDKILFIVNNLAPNNLEVKVKDMQERIEEAYFRWFANYLVDQRVSIEPNNHHLYMQFLDALNHAALFKEVLQETLIRAEVLLNSEQTIQSSNQRTLLKNLGSWLGALTLAKNKPIKHKNVSFKDLLIQGYESNRLIVAIPFVCKVLEQCAKSRIFKLPNPWLMAILKLLVEFYQFAELKLNLKFEIEVLCKNLNIDLKEIQPTTTLRDRPPKDAALADQAAAGATQDSEKALAGGFGAAGSTQGGADLSAPNQSGRLPAPPSGLSLLGAAGSSGAAGYSLALADAITAALASIPNFLSFSPQVSAFSSNAGLKRLVQLGIDRAVREIIAPVVERSVTIAGISTRELTIKDFAMEGNEERMRHAAHLMVQNLAGSLALVTCKEPLRMSIVAHIRALMLQNGFSEQNLPEQAIMIIANDNLELACSVVEKVAMDKAVVEVDDSLAPAYMTRLKHRERSNQAFWDTAAMAASHYSGMLPDPLRLKLGGLQPNQVRVYEDFGKRTVSTYLQPETTSVEEAAVAAAQAAGPAAPVNTEGQAPGGLLTAQQATEIFGQLMTELDKALADAEAAGIHAATSIPHDHEIHSVLRQLPVVASRSFVKDETTLSFSQKIVQFLYRSETALAREVYVALLQRLCDISAKVAKEVTAWLIYAPDERKFNVPVTVLLLESGFISVAEYDAQLAKFIAREFRPTVVNFGAQLARECILAERPVASREHFGQTLRALAQAVQAGKGGESAAFLLDELRNNASSDTSNKSQLNDQAVREQLTMCFVEWVRIYQQSYQIEKAFVEFVVQLQNQGILKGEEISSLFFRVCAEVSVESYIKQKAAGGTPATGLFQPVDAFAKLITFMIKYHADPQNKNNDQAKVHYMTKVLSIVVLVLAQSHEELGPHFQQKPFYRFFSSLLSNLNQIEVHLGSAYYQILTALSHSINTLQPLFFSGFTFSWMALVSHRLFMPKLLNMKDRDGWSSFHRLLVSLLRFLAPFLSKGEMSESIRTIYLGTIRTILVLLHDFPEFLTVYYYSLSDVIPSSCTQLHNLISSAFPLSTKLPDPLRVKAVAGNIPELLSVAPTLLSDFTAALQPAELRSHLERKLQQSVERGMPTGLSDKLFLPEGRQAIANTRYNVPLINSIVMFCGSVAMAQSKAQSGQPAFQANYPSVNLLHSLVEELDPEGSYLVLSAAATHLRYPNSHSNWFSSWLIHLFNADAGGSESKKQVKAKNGGEGDKAAGLGERPRQEAEYIKEQIVRVLLERLVAHRPHPFSVISTFVQLLKDEKFFEHSFVTKSPEVQMLLKNMKNSLTVASSAASPTEESNGAVTSA